MATSAYTNDDHLDIAYMLVFNYISLQERVRLRIICNRWKNVIEADCAQITTLRVFGTDSDKSEYIWRSKHEPMKSPTAELPEEELKRKSNPWNTITLKRPKLNQTDLSFLTRLFPAVQNLALTWDGIIDGFLRFWAPNLRELYLVTPSYKAEEQHPASGDDISLDAEKISPFFQCLALMAPTLQKLSLGGLRGEDFRDAAKSLVLSSLEDFTYYNVENNNYEILMSNTDQLSKFAPVLQSFRLPMETDFSNTSQSVWMWEVPATVSRLAFYQEQTPYPENYTICPSVTHLELQFGEFYCTEGAEVLPLLIKKFPNTKFLAITKGHDFPRWLTEKGEEFESAGFLAALARRPPGPFDGIEELYLGSVTTYIFVYHWRRLDDDDYDDEYYDDDWVLNSARYKEKKANYDLIFRGIAGTFKGLKKLTLAIAPDTERKHRAWYKKFADFKDRYMPEVEMAFVLEIDVDKRGEAFKEGPDLPKSTANQCFLAPGCVFVPQADKPKVKKRAAKKMAPKISVTKKPAAKKANKKQRTK